MSITIASKFGSVDTANAYIALEAKDNRLYLLLDYTKGSETSIDLTFSFDSDDPQNTFFFLTSRVSPATKYTATLTATGKWAIPVPFPAFARNYRIHYAYNGSTSAVGDLTVHTQAEEGMWYHA